MHEEHNAAPGWYPDPDGQKRYWDGAQWLDLPNPEPQPPQWKTLAHSKVGWITVSCLILALGIGLAMKLSTMPMPGPKWQPPNLQLPRRSKEKPNESLPRTPIESGAKRPKGRYDA